MSGQGHEKEDQSHKGKVYPINNEGSGSPDRVKGADKRKEMTARKDRVLVGKRQESQGIETASIRPRRHPPDIPDQMFQNSNRDNDNPMLNQSSQSNRRREKRQVRSRRGEIFGPLGVSFPYPNPDCFSATR